MFQPKRLAPEKNYGKHLSLYVLGTMLALFGGALTALAVFAYLVGLPFPDWTPYIKSFGVAGVVMLVIGIYLHLRYRYVME